MPFSKEPFESAFEEGAKARSIGKPASANPYTTLTSGGTDSQADTIEKFAAWKLGWEKENVRGQSH
jgi:hypothetical protein